MQSRQEIIQGLIEKKRRRELDPVLRELEDIRAELASEERVKRVALMFINELRLMQKGDKGETGDSPTIDYNRIIEEVVKLIPVPKNGKDGYTPIKGIDYFDGEDGVNGKDASPIYKTEVIKQELTVDDTLVKSIIKIMSTLPENDKLEIQSIRNANSFIFGKTKYKIEELMHGGGSSSSSSSGYQQPTSGIVDGVNQIFTWAVAPSVIVVDQGRAMQRVSSDGTVNWVAAGLTTTLTIAPTIDIYATA